MDNTLESTMESSEENVQESGPHVQLPAILDLKAAAPLAAAFLSRRGTDIVVDATDVQRLGGQCLQVLLSTLASWAEDERCLKFENPSQDFLSAIELFGVEPDLLFHRKESSL